MESRLLMCLPFLMSIYSGMRICQESSLHSIFEFGAETEAPMEDFALFGLYWRLALAGILQVRIPTKNAFRSIPYSCHWRRRIYRLAFCSRLVRYGWDAAGQPGQADLRRKSAQPAAD